MDVDKAKSELFNLLDATEDDLYHKDTLELLQVCEAWCSFRTAVQNQIKELNPQKIGELHSKGVHLQLEHFVDKCLSEELIQDAVRNVVKNSEAEDKFSQLEEKMEAELPEEYKQALRLCKGTKYFPPFQGENMGGPLLSIEEVGLFKEISPELYSQWEQVKEEFGADGGEEALQISKVCKDCVLVLWPHIEHEEHEEHEGNDHPEEEEKQEDQQQGEKAEELYEVDPNWQLVVLDLKEQDFEDLGSFKYFLANQLVNSVEVGLVPEME
eukprot:TRINITY_DN1291_c0_g2_i6.p1 TRINITY_DN1291_c0_g2~~TRINITY_DN1291_c0_g2_i6.p1  ORF type:complete len:269 (-),score=58.71 TRINITY_DN1291_c0_g2_i6:236-1042(-)